MPSKYLIILNPSAGSGSGLQALPEIEKHLQDAGLNYDLERTERPGHARELAAAGVDSGYDVIVSAGGDGTSNEVINGLMDRSHFTELPRLGLLSAGRGNDFAHAVHVPEDLSEACRLLASGDAIKIDLGQVRIDGAQSGLYFGNCVGIGFDAVTTIEARKLPRLGGFVSFLVAVLKTIFLYHRGPVVHLQVDETELELQTLMVSIMNGQRLGDGFWMAPEASPSDGVFDLCIADQVSRRRILTLLPHFMKGSQYTQPEITSATGSRIIVTNISGGLPAHADGEIICTQGQRLEIDVIPNALSVISGKEGNR